MKTARKKAVVVDCAFPDLERERAAAAAGDASFVALQNAAESEIVEALRDADLVFAQFARIPEAAVAAMRTGAVIVRYGVGLDNLPLAACAARGVRVCNVPDYGAEEVADHALAMLLGLHRRLPQLDAAVRAGEWGGDDRADAVAPIDSLTLGILGFGRIGRAVAKRASAFGVACAACDPAADEEAIHAAGATPVALAELWRRADWLSLHAPSTPATRQILNRESLAQTKRGVIVVNCARRRLDKRIRFGRRFALRRRRRGRLGCLFGRAARRRFAAARRAECDSHAAYRLALEPRFAALTATRRRRRACARCAANLCAAKSAPTRNAPA